MIGVTTGSHCSRTLSIPTGKPTRQIALGQTLYSDYFTVVDFYLRRNDLNRTFGLQTRYPFLDPVLVEFCARIPSKYKVRGWFDSKHIMKKAIEPWLPHEIVYRKDKLGTQHPAKELDPRQQTCPRIRR